MNKKQFNKIAFANGFNPYYSGKSRTMFLRAISTISNSIEERTNALVEAIKDHSYSFNLRFV